MKKFSATIAAVLLTSVFVFGGVLGAPNTAFAVSPPNSPSSDAPTGPALGTCGIKTPAGTTQNMPNLMTNTACTQLSGTWTVDPSGRTEEVTSQNPAQSNGKCISIAGGIDFTSCALIIPGIIASNIILPMVSWLTTISGVILNYSVDKTIVQMASSFSDNNGIGGAITSVWGTVRDLANMMFIFILLFTAIKTMLGQGKYQQVIKNIVIAAILINFSLFFTKVIIDAGNLLALTFYGAIAPGALAANHTVFNSGISNSLMNQLHISSIWGGGVSWNQGSNLFTIGVMGSIMAMVAAFVFFSAAIMLVIRYVVLIFVLVLSPLMFIGSLLPGAGKGYGKQWMDALINQTFFAPVYFFLLWIVVKFASAIYHGPTDISGVLASSYTADHKLSTNPDTFAVLLNYIMIIVFLNIAIVTAKTMSNKAGGIVSDANKWAMGFAGKSTFGVAGKFGRGTVGRYAQRVADSEDLKERAAAGSISARLQLAAARKTAGASFDLRGSGLVNKDLQAGKAQEGGFAKDLKTKIDNEKKAADNYKVTDLNQYRAEQAYEDVKENKASPATIEKLQKERIKDQEHLAKERDALVAYKNERASNGASSDELKEIDTRIERNNKDSMDANNTLERYARSKMDQLKGVNEGEAKKRAAAALGKSEADFNKMLGKNATAEDKKTAQDAIKTEQRESGNNARRINYARGMETQLTLGKNFDWLGRIAGVGPVKKEYQSAAIEIRKGAKEKSKEKKLAEAVEALAPKADDETEAAASAAAPETPSATPPPPAAAA